MQTCKERISDLIICKSRNPFIKAAKTSGIAEDDIHLLETDDCYYMIVKGDWGYTTDWFPKKTDFTGLKDGICFYLYKNHTV